MAKKKDASWVPSMGVLAVAIAAGLVAAILVNVYIGVAESRYEAGAMSVLQLKEDVRIGDKIQSRSLEMVKIPRPLQEAFKSAVKAEDRDTVVVGRPALHGMRKGQILFYADFIADKAGEPAKIKLGYALMTVPINADSNLGQQLQPGGYVDIFGDFNFSSDPKQPDYKNRPVMENVQVLALGGSTEPVAQKSRAYDDIQIMVRKTQVPQLNTIRDLLRTRRFQIAVTSMREGPVGDPDINKEILALIEKPKAGGPAAPPAPPGN
jgi:Flp pilus assembly protein CpaB